MRRISLIATAFLGVCAAHGCAELSPDDEGQDAGGLLSPGFTGGGAAMLDAYVPAGGRPGPQPGPQPEPGPVDAALPGPQRFDAGPQPRFDAARPPPPDAAVCVAEVCNGLDDDCDGEIDNGAACPCEVRQRDGRAYMFCADALLWSEARFRCEQSGYSLAVVDDAAEDAYLFDQIDLRGFDDTWIGLNDRQQEGLWVWLDGVPVVYEHWDNGEPNDGGGGEDCGLIMTRNGRQSEWDDRPCDSGRPSICEAPPPAP
ncbi:MAG: C-type lectin domain-containing protein [Planctomycetota bacterium]